MSGFDYGNARVRAMKSRLLNRRESEALAETRSIEGLIGALIKTDYRKAVETALARTRGLECIGELVRRNLVDTVGKVRSFYRGRAGDFVATILRLYDVHNLKAILRGLSRGASLDEISAALLPMGELMPVLLTRLASASGPRIAIDLLVSARISIAQPLLNLRTEHPGAGLFEMELALDKWYFQHAYRHVQRSPGRAALLCSALNLEADLTNLLTVLRFAHSPAEHRALHERLGRDDIRHLFVGPGRLPFKLLAQAGEQDSLEQVVHMLARTPYESPLRSGLEAYARSGQLSDMEKRLRRFRLRWMAQLFVEDPLGIGVPLGYLALKTSEAVNIRWIAQGISIGLEVDAIKAELEFAA